jgi:hypothetical protein
VRLFQDLRRRIDDGQSQEQLQARLSDSVRLVQADFLDPELSLYQCRALQLASL